MSWDGWKGEYFHAKCGKKGETIAVIRSNGGFIFGGFSDKPWTSSGNKWCKSDRYLLLSFNIISNKVVTTKIHIIQDMCSNVMDHCIVYGPTFVDYLYIDIYSN